MQQFTSVSLLQVEKLMRLLITNTKKKKKHQGYKARYLPRFSLQLLCKIPKNFFIAPLFHFLQCVCHNVFKKPETSRLSYNYLSFELLAFSFKLWIKILLLSPLSRHIKVMWWFMRVYVSALMSRIDLVSKNLLANYFRNCRNRDNCWKNYDKFIYKYRKNRKSKKMQQNSRL